MIVSHHPLLFRPLKSVTGKDYVERVVRLAIKNDVTLYAAHTNLDNAPGGVNHKMAEKMGLQHLRWLEPKNGMEGGSGLVGELPSPVSKERFVSLVKQLFCVDCVRYSEWNGDEVKRVAVCGGSGAFLIPNAVSMKADAFITGEIGYHRFFGHENELMLMEIGHYESELHTLEILHDIIRKTAAELPIVTTTVKTNPIRYES